MPDVPPIIAPVFTGNNTAASVGAYQPLTKAWKQLRAHPTQSALWRTNARFVKVPAGRGSGKTEIAKRRLVRFLPVDRWEATQRGSTQGRPNHAKTEPHLYAYLGPTRPQAKRIAWEHLKKLIPADYRKCPPYETDLIIKTIFNSELHVIGMDAPQRFEGDQWDGVVEDEASDQKPNIHLAIRPAISFKKGWWWKIGVPKRQGIGAQNYRAECEMGFAGLAAARGQGSGDPAHATYTWPSWDILDAQEVAQAKRDFDSKDFSEQYGGNWEEIGGSAFHEFEKAVHVRPCTYNPYLPIIVGSDFNVNPMGWVLCHVGRNTDGQECLEVFDEVFLSDTWTQKTLNVLWDRYGEQHKGGWIFYGDATARARHTSAALSDYAQILHDARYAPSSQLVYPDSNPNRKDRLSSCNAILRNAAGDVRCHIDPKVVNLIADLENRGLDDDGAPTEGKSGEKIGHISDGWGYIVHAKWPTTYLEPEDGSTASIALFTGDDD